MGLDISAPISWSRAGPYSDPVAGANVPSRDTGLGDCSEHHPLILDHPSEGRDRHLCPVEL